MFLVAGALLEVERPFVAELLGVRSDIRISGAETNYKQPVYHRNEMS